MHKKMEEGKFSWSAFRTYRADMLSAFRSVYGMEIKRDLLDVLESHVKGDETVLDVGAGHKKHKKQILNRFPDLDYKTMDIDRFYEHDYYDLETIDEKFHIIVFSEVIEHLEFLDGVRIIEKLSGLLRPNGKIFVSTPNIYHPNTWLRDPDHKTPYMYDSLGALLLNADIKVDNIYRVYKKKRLVRLIKQYVAGPLYKYFEMDFARSLIAVGSKR